MSTRRKRMTVLHRRHHVLRALLVAGAMLAAVLAACSQPAEQGESPSRSAPTLKAEQPQTPAPQPAEQAVPLPTETASPTPAPAIPTPTLPQEATKAAPPPAPTPHPGMTPEARPANASGAPFVQVSAGPFHTCGLRAGGTITCWGAHGEDERLTESTGLLDSPPGVFSQIDAGHHNSCAIRQDGAVQCWGSMFVEDDIPPEAKAMMEAMWAPPEGRFISVSAGFLFSCGVRNDNTAECWGLAPLPLGRTDPAGGRIHLRQCGWFPCLRNPH